MTTERRARLHAQWEQLTDAMTRYADGDLRAFDTVYRLLAPAVRGLHRRHFSESAAEDLTQQTFLRVHAARQGYRRHSPVGPWVLRIAHNLGVDELRRRGRARVVLTDDGETPERGHWPPDDAAGHLADALRGAVEKLPQGERAVVSMHKLEGRPFTEVARLLDISVGNARVRAHRGYRRLRRILTEPPLATAAS